jgi:hypothetical protein
MRAFVIIIFLAFLSSCYTSLQGLTFDSSVDSDPAEAVQGPRRGPVGVSAGQPDGGVRGEVAIQVVDGSVDTSVDSVFLGVDGTVVFEVGLESSVGVEVALPVDRFVDTSDAMFVEVPSRPEVSPDVLGPDVRVQLPEAGPETHVFDTRDAMSDVVDVKPVQADVLLGLGAVCSQSGQCGSGHCSFGACCSESCSGGCYTGCGANGQCQSCPTCSCSAVTGICHC